jgi:hypothetical protein
MPKDTNHASGNHLRRNRHRGSPLDDPRTLRRLARSGLLETYFSFQDLHSRTAHPNPPPASRIAKQLAKADKWWERDYTPKLPPPSPTYEPCSQAM